jgi:hypothetical protein
MFRIVFRLALFAWVIGGVILILASLSYFAFGKNRENAFARLLVSLWTALVWPLAAFSPDGRRLLAQMMRGTP